MPLFAFYADRPEKHRSDGVNLLVANGTDAEAARAVGTALVGLTPGTLNAFAVVELTDATPPFVVQGHPPVGGRTQTTWPTHGRAGARLAGD